MRKSCFWVIGFHLFLCHTWWWEKLLENQFGGCATPSLSLPSVSLCLIFLCTEAWSPALASGCTGLTVSPSTRSCVSSILSCWLLTGLACTALLLLAGFPPSTDWPPRPARAAAARAAPTSRTAQPAHCCTSTAISILNNKCGKVCNSNVKSNAYGFDHSVVLLFLWSMIRV